MRRLLLALLLLCAPAFAAEPKASIKGPTTATVGVEVVLDISGSVSDADFPIQIDVAGDGEFKPSLEYGFTRQGTPWRAVFLAPRPGSYTVVVVAIGKPEGQHLNTTKIAAWPITVEPIAPAPKPDPEPGPNPPAPEPPTPSPVTGKLWGVLIVPDSPSPDQAALRTDAEIRAAFAKTSTIFRTYLQSESEIQAAGWKTALANAGGAPAVLWIDSTAKVVKATGQPDKAKILADLKVLRGGN